MNLIFFLYAILEYNETELSDTDSIYKELYEEYQYLK